MAGALRYECEHRDFDELEVINNDPTTSAAEVFRTYELAARIFGKATVNLDLSDASDYFKTNVRVVEAKEFEQKLELDNPTLRLRIEGHTDDVGKPGDNLKLSRQRAAAVVEWLTKKGVDKARLSSEGYGDTKPVADNEDDAGKAKNRRVELAKL